KYGDRKNTIGHRFGRLKTGVAGEANSERGAGDICGRRQVGFWFVNSEEARAHASRIQKFKAKGLIGLRRHRPTDGEFTDAYEVTDRGLARLEELTDAETAAVARGRREHLREQARKPY